MYIDTHCHLNFDAFDIDRMMVIGNAKKVGVKKFINPGNSIFSSHEAMKLALKNPGVIYAAVGIHPYEITSNPDIKEIESIINYQLSITNSSLVAIGECGLDYHPYQEFPASGKKTEQKQLFEVHCRLALKYSLPIIIHCREAFEDVFQVLDGLPTMPKGVFHCFTGGLADAREIEKRGFFIGLDGNSTYSKQLKAVIPTVPLSMILLETDSPYLPPEGHRGERSEPKYVVDIAKNIATLKNIELKEVEEQTTKNAKQLFHI